MAHEFSLTGHPVRVTATCKQALPLVLDVSGYDEMDLELGVFSIEGTNNPSVTVRIITSMQNMHEDGWLVAGTFTNITASNSFAILNIKNFLKYIRWEVSVLAGTTPAATFGICGMLRRWA